MKLLLNKLDFHRSAEDLASDYTYLSDIDKAKVVNIDSKATFDYEDDHMNYTCYLLIDPKEIEKYKKVLDDNLIHYLCTDISHSVIKNEINIEKVLLKYVNSSNKFDYDIFMDEIDIWISENLDMDTILDMINERGINSLREVDREFLKKV
jgi:hypothetical protein